MNKRAEVKEKIMNVFKSGIKDHYLIGAEFEHFIVNKLTLESYHYYEPLGIRSILLKMKAFGWVTSDTDEKIMELKKGDGIITLEPGGQIELSIMPAEKVSTLTQIYKSFIEDIKSCLSEEQAIISTGYHPVSRIADIPFIPKSRYDEMSAYFNLKGRYAHNMMKGTAATQVGVDFVSEEDCMNKYRMFSALSPFFTSFFDTTPFFEGENTKGFAMRMQIWEETDSDRSGVLKEAFTPSFSFGEYAERVLKCPPILIREGDHVKATHELSFEELIDDVEINQPQINHVLTMLFPDVRLKNFIEIRMADAMPYPLNLGYVELIYGLTYCSDLLNYYSDWAKTCTYEEIQLLKNEVSLKGNNAEFRGQTVRTFMLDLLDKVSKSCHDLDHFESLRNTYESHTNGYIGYLQGLSKDKLLSELEVNFNE
jgi:glutamate--cysteine ligase